MSPPPRQTASTATTSSEARATLLLGSTAGTSGLKQIDQAALQNMLDTTTRELLNPGAVVLLRTP